MTAAIQLQLFAADPHEHLYPWWRKMMNEWPGKVFQYRHYRWTTGWSMASQNFCYARWLFQAGQIDRAQFRRRWKFNRRVKRWNSFANRLTA